jgi:hypothetical protein
LPECDPIITGHLSHPVSQVKSFFFPVNIYPKTISSSSTPVAAERGYFEIISSLKNMGLYSGEVPCNH